MAENGVRDLSRSRKKALIGERQRRAGSEGISVYIDTEFNAFDYYGQNNGCQEILEIGIAVLLDGKEHDKFKSCCRPAKGHVLTRRASKLTGITDEDMEFAPSFPEALDEMNKFLDQYRPRYIYAYGTEDKLQLTNTAKLYSASASDMRYIERVKDNLRTLNKMLGIEKKNLTLSVKDLCAVCGYQPENMHNAYYDALYLGKCTETIYSGAYDPENVTNIFERKAWMSGYHSNRRVREKRDEILLDDRELEQIRAYIDRLNDGTQYRDFVFAALMDDILMLSGHDPEAERI